MTGNFAKQKMGNKKGFSLAELLFALLITSLAGLIVIGGISVTTRLFQDVLLHSQTQLVMKEYMSELRSGLLSAEMDSSLQVVEYNSSDPQTTDPAFAHSAWKCAGYFKLVSEEDVTMPAPMGEGGKQWGVIMFQPAYYDYDTNSAEKNPVDETLPTPLRLISSRLSDDFPAWMTYRYDGEKFILSLSVRSKGVLSTGEHVELTTENIEITPTGK